MKKELSEYYFVNSQGYLCCYIDGQIAIVIGAMQSGNYLHFIHKPIKEEDNKNANIV